MKNPVIALVWKGRWLIAFLAGAAMGGFFLDSSAESSKGPAITSKVESAVVAKSQIDDLLRNLKKLDRESMVNAIVNWETLTDLGIIQQLYERISEIPEDLRDNAQEILVSRWISLNIDAAGAYAAKRWQSDLPKDLWTLCAAREWAARKGAKEIGDKLEKIFGNVAKVFASTDATPKVDSPTNYRSIFSQISDCVSLRLFFRLSKDFRSKSHLKSIRKFSPRLPCWPLRKQNRNWRNCHPALSGAMQDWAWCQAR